MTTNNFLYRIFLEYEKTPSSFCISLGCTTCGNEWIRGEIFQNLINSIGLKFEDTGIDKVFRGLHRVKDPLFDRLLEVLVLELNKLEDDQLHHMLGVEPWMFEGFRRDNVLWFLIMDIYNSKFVKTGSRWAAIDFLRSKITNQNLLRVIEKMNSRREKESKRRLYFSQNRTSQFHWGWSPD